MQDSTENSLAISLKAESLCCVKNDLVLFEGLDIELGQAEVLQVNGANGSGKTSLLRILCGLSQAEDGQVSWCGRDIHAYRAEYHRELAYMGHTNAIKADLNLVENLQLSRALCGKASEASLEDIISRVALDDHIDIPAGRLSSGQKRRLAFARLLVTDASLWILDEPLNSLDEGNKLLAANIIREHVHNGGSVVLTSHEELNWQTTAVQEINL